MTAGSDGPQTPAQRLPFVAYLPDALRTTRKPWSSIRPNGGQKKPLAERQPFEKSFQLPPRTTRPNGTSHPPYQSNVYRTPLLHFSSHT